MLKVSIISFEVPTWFDDIQLRRHLFHEILDPSQPQKETYLIVSDKNDGTLELLQERTKSLNAVHIQMVGRFIQDNQMRFCVAHGRKNDTTLLTTRQGAHGLHHPQ